MTKPNRVFILFERSGVFKKAFDEIGIPATDYDLEAEHDQVIRMDLFAEINRAYDTQEKTLFNEITPHDLILAFFPCTYFSDQAQLYSRCDSYSMQNYTDEHKLELSMSAMEQRNLFYNTLCKLVLIAKRNGLRMIIENPYGHVCFLKWYFPIKPEIIIHDRRALGDSVKKATQFFFINCKALFSLIPPYGRVTQRKDIATLKGFARSRIEGDFAKNFIEKYLRGDNWEEQDECILPEVRKEKQLQLC